MIKIECLKGRSFTGTIIGLGFLDEVPTLINEQAIALDWRCSKKGIKKAHYILKLIFDRYP